MLRILKHFEWPTIWCCCIDCKNHWGPDSRVRASNSRQGITYSHSINFWSIACRSANSLWRCLVIFNLGWGNFWRCYARTIHFNNNSSILGWSLRKLVFRLHRDWFISWSRDRDVVLQRRFLHHVQQHCNCWLISEWCLRILARCTNLWKYCLSWCPIRYKIPWIW